MTFKQYIYVVFIWLAVSNFSVGAQVVKDRPVIVELTRQHVDSLLEVFWMDSASHNYGGFAEKGFKEFADTRGSIYNGQYLFAAYVYPDFEDYYNHPEILEKILAHLDFMNRRQRDDGSIGLGSRIIGGPNEVGFTLPGLVEAYKKVRDSKVDGKQEILDGLETYILKGAQCIRDGFPYTSNHRWAANCGPLAMANALFPDSRNQKYIEGYLADGIDMDENGMYYEERSPNYNIVANWGLMEIADYWNRRDLLELVGRNLEYSLVMRQPSGEAETMFSHRQDRGSADKIWGSYFQFKRMGIEFQNGVFASAADSLFSRIEAQNRLPDGAIPLIFLFDDQDIAHDNVKREPIPEKFEMKFSHGPIWRHRTKDVAVTVAADHGGHWWDVTQSTWKGPQRSDLFMNYHYRDAIIDGVRIRWTGGNESFHPEEIEYMENGSLRMVYDDPGWDHVAHFRPKEKWGPRRIEGHNKGEVVITPLDSGSFRLKINITGWEDVFTNIQLLLREDCELIPQGGDTIELKKAGNSFSATEGSYFLKSPSGNMIEIAGIKESQHSEVLGDRSYIETSADGRCHKLILGLFTPVDMELIFKPVHK